MPFKGVTSLIAKWYLLHERAIVSPKNIECVPFSYNLQLLEPCKRSANNCIATRKFTSCQPMEIKYLVMICIGQRKSGHND